MAYTTIDDPTAYFQTKTYTGSAGAQSITFDGNSDLQPDWIWIKERGAAGGHVVTDTVRGISASSAPFLQPSSTGAEIDGNGTVANRTLTSSNTNGFTLGQDAYYTNFNNNSDTYVSWNWKAGGSSSTNTDGSQNTTVSVNTTAGFSIVKWTGADSTGSLGHGLGAVPKMIIAKRLATRNWTVYHVAMGANKKLFLNTTAAETSIADFDATPTSSVINVGYTDDANGSGSDYIGYAFAEKQGYSKFGSYTGNGNADGTFVYTGFKPAFIMTKSSATTSNWEIKDNKRLGYNPVDTYIKANATAAEDTGVSSHAMDFLSNGFKHKGNNDEVNGSGEAYIYMAFAENPFVTSTGVPATAR